VVGISLFAACVVSAQAAGGSTPPSGDTEGLAQLEKTRLECEAKLKQDPNDQAALRRLIMVLFDLGRYTEALNLLDRVPEQMPGLPGTQPADAPAAPKQPVAVPAPKPPPAAAAKKPVPALEKARQRYESMLKENPDDQEALRGLVTTLFDMGRYEEALQLLDQQPGDTKQAVTPPVKPASPPKTVAKPVPPKAVAPPPPPPKAVAAPAPPPPKVTPPEPQKGVPPPVGLSAEGITRIKTQLGKAQKDLAAAKKDFAAQAGEYEKFKQSSRQKELALAELIEDLDSRVRESAKAMAETKQALAEQKKQYEALQGKADEYRSQFDQRIAALTQKAAAASKQVAKAQAELEKERERRTALEKRVARDQATQQKRLRALRGATARKDKELAAAKKELNRERARYGKLQATSTEAVGLLGEQVDEMSREAAIAESKLDALDAALAMAKGPAAPAAEVPPGADVRAVEIDLDLIQDDSPGQTEVNIGKALGRILDMDANAVYVRAYSDADRDGTAEAVYFSNSVMQVRSGLLGAVAGQLRNRGISVYACMPTLAIALNDEIKCDRSQVLESYAGMARVPPGMPRRLSPFSDETLDVLGRLYGELAASVQLDGIVFEDDAYLTDKEDFSPAALARARAVLGEDFVSAEGLTESRKIKWTRLKTRQIDTVLQHVAAIVREQQPELRIARTIYAPAVLMPHAEEWLAQNYLDALRDYDAVVVNVAPEEQGVHRVSSWLKKLAEEVAKAPDGIAKTVFKVATRDELKGRWISEQTLRKRCEILRKLGASHVAYGPDDFEIDRPRMAEFKDALTYVPPPPSP